MRTSARELSRGSAHVSKVGTCTGHVPTCPRPDAQLSLPTLCVCLLRHHVHILASYCCVWALVLLVGRFPKSARMGSRNPADPQVGTTTDPASNFGGPELPHQTPPDKTNSACIMLS